MKLTRVIAISVIAASLGLGVVNAQSFSPMDTPAEFPPASYKGKQYVDSRGCVYIRAGVDGAVAWVPRVTRDRKVICGFKPSLPKGTVGVAPAPKLDKNVVQIQPAAKPSEQPSIFGTPKPASKPAATTAPKATTVAKPAAKPAPKPAPKAATAAAPKPAPKPQTTTVRAAQKPKPAPKPKAASTTATRPPLYTTPTAQKPKARAAAPAPAPTTAPAPATAPRRTTAQPPRAAGSLSPCRNGATTYKGMAVRCGPQSESPVTPGRGGPTAPPPKIQFDRQSALTPGAVGQVVREGDVHPQTRVVPRHVYEHNLVTHVSAAVPPGYRRVFDDGRLNPRRAEMTFAGKAQADRIWTRETPRQLIHRRTGEVIVLSSKSSSKGAPFEPEPAPVAAEPVSAPSAPVVSTRSTASEKSLRLAGTPYVQIGTFGSSDAAQAAARSVQRLGLPVRIGKFEREGATQRLVLAGPFATVPAAEKALEKSWDAGFNGAFVRQ